MCQLAMAEEKKTNRSQRLKLGGALGNLLSGAKKSHVSSVSLWLQRKGLKVYAGKRIYDKDIKPLAPTDRGIIYINKRPMSHVLC